MKTLKKTLCLVLAVVMVVGALVLPASAAYKDVNDIGADYKAAVEMLDNWNVMEGDATGNFKPKASIQRQEMAAIIYRLLTGDNEGYGKDNSAIYTPYAAKFTDVDAKGWAAGYIGYCVNKGIIVGVNAEGTLFDPTRAIPGNDVLCMLLRALGYGKNKEYQGADWAKHIASDATRLHLTDGITSKLDAISQRQEVALMTYQAATATRVTWSNAEKDYIPYVDPNDPSSEPNIPLVKASKPTSKTDDPNDFGQPGSKTDTYNFEFTYPVKSVTDKWTVTTAPAMVDYWEPVTECDVAEAIGLGDTVKDSQSFTTYTNGIKNVGTDTIEALDTINTIGHQGRHTLVYKDNKVIVYIDTYLAKVTSTTSEVLDPNSHVMVQGATATLDIYSNRVANPNTTASGNIALAADPILATGTIKNTNGYVKGDMILVNVLTKAPYNAMRTATGKASFDVTEDATEIFDLGKANTAEVTIASIKQDPLNFDLPTEKPSALTEVGFVGTNGTAYYYNFTYGYNNGSSTQRVTTEDINKTYTVYLDTQGNVLGLAPVVNAPKFGVLTEAGLVQVTGTLNQYVIGYKVLLPDGQTVTVYGVNPDTNKPYTDAAKAQTYINLIKTNLAINPMDAGILIQLVPQAGGYYTLVAAGKGANNTGTFGAVGIATTNNAVFERGEADALDLKTGMTSVSTGTWKAAPYVNVGSSKMYIDDLLVDNTTVFFVGNYEYKYTANEYQFTNFTVTRGFKSIKDLSYNDTVPASSASATQNNTNYIDGNKDPKLELAAFDEDLDGYADYVMVLNANHQEVPAAVETFNYAFLLMGSKFVTTDIDHNVYNYAIFNGAMGNTLTATAAAAKGIQNTGLYVYSNNTINGYDKVIFVSGNASTPTPTPSIPDWSIDAVTSGTGWLVKDGVLVVGPNGPTASTSQNRGTVGLANLGNARATGAPVNDKYLTLADNVDVYLINTTTGASVKTPYDLTTLDNADVYGQNAIAYQFDANGYVNLIYIIEKGRADSTHEPGTLISKVDITVSFAGFKDKAPTASGATVTVTPTPANSAPDNTPTVTKSVKWQWFNTDPGTENFNQWIDCEADECFNIAYDYRMVITLTASTGNYFDSTTTIVPNGWGIASQTVPTSATQTLTIYSVYSHPNA